MKPYAAEIVFGIVFWLAASAGRAPAEELPVKPLIDFGAPDAAERIGGGGGNSGVTFKIVDGAQGKALEVAIRPGQANYPGVFIKPGGAAWDLSASGHVEARVVNTGARAFNLNLRVDNPDENHDNPWCSEMLELKPGASGTIVVIFGYSYGRKPGYALNPGKISRILLFTGKAKGELSFRIESLVAAGPAGEKPPIDPKSIRVKPQNEVILGPGLTIDAAKQFETKGGAQATVADNAGMRIVFPAATGEQFAGLKPAIGRWELREGTELRVKVKNDGTTPLTPRVQALSDGGESDPVAATAPLAPGAEQELIVPFAPAVTWKGVPNSGNRSSWDGQKGTGTRFGSDAVSAIRISAAHEGDAALLVRSIAVAAPVAEIPDWLGQRPPVEGEWTKTFDDEFDGAEIDLTKWSYDGPNFWDKSSHWSKDNVIVDGGVVRLRYEKKTGFQNDDPKQKQSAHASGFLQTFGKWVQRYGYFEARMKLPRVPGLWPAFWMMPDRGAGVPKRGETSNGGMEFDIMEHLTRWGPFRYNIAMHWDGYGNEHKQTGSEHLYVQPDKDGFITSGLLWTPGSAIYYCNGKEIARWEDPRISSVPAHMMFTLPTGGWDNDALDDAQLPADFTIDYVRVWQRKDLASGVDGYQTQPGKEKGDLQK